MADSQSCCHVLKHRHMILLADVEVKSEELEGFKLGFYLKGKSYNGASLSSFILCSLMRLLTFVGQVERKKSACMRKRAMAPHICNCGAVKAIKQTSLLTCHFADKDLQTELHKLVKSMSGVPYATVVGA